MAITIMIPANTELIFKENFLILFFRIIGNICKLVG
jgi:hypothetical protein